MTVAAVCPASCTAVWGRSWTTAVTAAPVTRGVAAPPRLSRIGQAPRSPPRAQPGPPPGVRVDSRARPPAGGLPRLLLEVDDAARPGSSGGSTATASDRRGRRGGDAGHTTTSAQGGGRVRRDGRRGTLGSSVRRRSGERRRRHSSGAARPPHAGAEASSNSIANKDRSPARARAASTRSRRSSAGGTLEVAEHARRPSRQPSWEPRRPSAARGRRLRAPRPSSSRASCDRRRSGPGHGRDVGASTQLMPVRPPPSSLSASGSVSTSPSRLNLSPSAS